MWRAEGRVGGGGGEAGGGAVGGGGRGSAGRAAKAAAASETPQEEGAKWLLRVSVAPSACLSLLKKISVLCVLYMHSTRASVFECACACGQAFCVQLPQCAQL